jgi:putative hydrolase of the HAD superfamily
VNRISILDINVVIFDLDDTLYDETTFVYSGFEAVATYLSNHFTLSADTLLEDFKKTLHTQGRGSVFNHVLQNYGFAQKSLITRCLHIYRTHEPKITLLPEAKTLLEDLKVLNIPVYIVTDGNKITQANKIKALGVDLYTKKSFITHRYGIHNAKPSPYCFEKIADLEQTSSDRIVYIGDNVQKDFIGIKPLGFHTIRIRNGMFKDLEPTLEQAAHHEIDHLLELQTLLQLSRRRERS